MDALKYLQECFSQWKLPAATHLESPPPPRVSPVQHILPHQRQRPPPRVRPLTFPDQDIRVPPTWPLTQDPKVQPKSPLPDSTPVSRLTRSQAQPPPAMLKHAPPHPLEPIAHHTCSRHELSHKLTAQSSASRKYPMLFLTNWSMPVLDEATGASLEYRKLRRHPRYCDVCNKSYSNELGRLCQGTGKDGTGINQ